MKNRLVKCTIFSLCAALLGGCAQVFPAQPPDVPTAFTCMAAFSQDGTDAGMQVTRAGDHWEFALYEPAAVDGITVVLDAGESTVNYAGMVVENADGKTGMVSVAAQVEDMLNHAGAKENVIATRTENGLEVTGTSDSGDYTLLFDNTTGALTKMENLDTGFCANITGFSITENAADAVDDVAVAD